MCSLQRERLAGGIVVVTNTLRAVTTTLTTCMTHLSQRQTLCSLQLQLQALRLRAGARQSLSLASSPSESLSSTSSSTSEKRDGRQATKCAYQASQEGRSFVLEGSKTGWCQKNQRWEVDICEKSDQRGSAPTEQGMLQRRLFCA